MALAVHMVHTALLVLLALLAVCCKAQTNSTNTTNSAGEFCGVDIVFLVDASGSVGSFNFRKTLDFVESVVNGLNIGPFEVRVGLIRFATSPSLQFHLNTYTDKQSVLSRVSATSYTGGGTDTARGLAYATDVSFTAINGMRSEAAQVAIVVTDGKSNSESATISEATRLKDKGVTVFSIGVGSGPQLSELNAMASDPDSDHVFQVNDFDALNQILNALQKGACDSDAAFLCGGLADIVFLLDESGSVGRENFAKMLQFVQDVMQEFIVGPSDIQVGLDTFSTSFNHEFFLNQVRSKAGLEALLRGVSYTGGSTNTGTAIRRMRLESFTASAGHRSTAPKIAIVVTDGKSQNKALTVAEAQAARDAGIVLLAIGIGQGVDTTELAAIATDPDSQNVHRAVAFDALSGLEDFIAAKTCAASQTPPASTVPCGSRADVVFLIDTSGSVGPDNFRLLLSFVNTFVKDVEIGQDKIRVGVAKFGSRPYREFNLDRYSNKTDLMAAINDIRYLDGGTDTAAAINYMDQVMFSAASGNRPGIPDIAVVVTDGKSNKPDEAKVAAEEARANGIIIFSVGVGDDISRAELNEIASDPDSSHVLTVKDFTKLNAIKAAFQIQTCRQIPTVLPTYVPPTTPAPTPLPDPCQDVIPNCAAYDRSVCTGFRVWATTFCARSCRICSLSPPVVAPPCEDKLANCSSYNVSECGASNKTWAEQNCRKYCGYCSPGTQTGGYFNMCYYKGRQHRQGERWNDGCAYECECVDASTGQYVCYNKCPSYYNLPRECPLVRRQGECCLKPICNFNSTYVTANSTGLCVYNGQNYEAGQIWSVGCSARCICLSTSGSFVCQNQCATYDWLPSNCKLVKRPGECCEEPVCEFESPVGVITGGGGTSGPGVGGPDPTKPGVCVFQGRVYRQGDSWSDGCDKLCYCDNATSGYVRCEGRCPSFLDLPTNCSMVSVIGQCCKSVFCDQPANFTGSQSTPGTTGAVPPLAPPPAPGQYPSLPPGGSYAPGQNPNPPSAPSPTPSSPEVVRFAPPKLTCGPAREGAPVNLTCEVDIAKCPNPFAITWSADSWDFAICSSNTCGGVFNATDTMDAMMTATGSIVTVRNVTRDSPDLSTRWGCEFCGGSPVTCDNIETYVLPERPVCFMREVTDPMTLQIMSVNLTCFTGRVFPAAKCSFEMKRDSGMFVPLTAQPSYSHAATGESPVHYSSGCSVIVPVGDLGEGTLRFRGFIYPDVTGGKSLVNATGIAESLTLALPRASHSCPPSMVEDYLCGKSSVCNCTLVSPGNPRGRAVWYMPDTARPLTADGAMVVTYDINKPAPHYTCEGVSALGRKFGSSLKFSTETQCG